MANKWKVLNESINWSKWTLEQHAFFEIGSNSDYMIKDIQKQLKSDKYGVFVEEGWTNKHERTIVVDSTEFNGRIFFVFKDDGYCYEYVGTNHDKVLFHKYDYVPNLFRKNDIEYSYDDSKWENKFTFVQPTIDTVVNESELILDNYVDIMNGDYTI